MADSTATAPPCVTGCTKDHTLDPDLGFRLCDSPTVTGLPAGDGRRLSVSASRVVEPGEPVFVTVAVAVDDHDAVELDPAAARELADALRRAAVRAEQSLPTTGEAA